MSRFAHLLQSNTFLITTELNPPKGIDLQEALERAEVLRGMVHAVNVTDSQSSIMTMSPLALAHLLQDRGIEPVLQLTCRDRNRIALQAELLGAYALGIENVLCMTGDPPPIGDHPEAKGVFDLEVSDLLRAASALTAGVDLCGNSLKGTPRFCLGAVVNPGARDPDDELSKFEQKVGAGAQFFQTQAIFDPGMFESFARRVESYQVPILAGVIILKSGVMARHLNQSLPGVHVPEALMEELDGARDKAQKGIEIAGRLVRELRDMSRGVHLMAIGWERRIPQVLEYAGLLERAGGL